MSAPAIHLAEEGFTFSDEEVGTLHSANLAKFPTSRRIYKRDGKSVELP